MSLSPEKRLELIEQLEERQSRNRVRAVWISWASVVAAAALLAAMIGLAHFKLSGLQTESAELVKTNEDLKKRASENRRLAVEAETRYKQAAKLINNFPLSEVEKAVDNQIKQDPRSALLPRIYTHFVDSEDRDFANRMAKAMRESGYIVLGVEYVPKAKDLKKSDVRYYRAVEGPEAEKIAAVLRKAQNGLIVRANHLAQFENSTTARPNHFEVWFASRALTLP